MTRVTNDPEAVKKFLHDASCTTPGRLDELEALARMVGIPLKRCGGDMDIPEPWLVFENDLVRIDIEARPSYCDRGAYKVLAESKDPTQLVVDHHDLFPRYYFFPMTCALEMAEWLRRRKQLPL